MTTSTSLGKARRTAQIAAEFIIMMTVAVLIAVVFLASVGGLIKESAERERTASLDDVGYTIQDELILAHTVTPGYTRTFTIPEKAGRFSYSISNTATTMTLVSGTVTLQYTIPEIMGTLAHGDRTISNTNGLVIS